MDTFTYIHASSQIQKKIIELNEYIRDLRKKYSYYTRDNNKPRHLRKQTLANNGNI